MVGLALSNTMFVNACTMQLPFLTSELLVNPLWQQWQSTVVNRMSQIHLNKAFAPSAFQVPTRLAMLINTLIITLLFNSALPLLFPLAFVAFASAYLTDKVHAVSLSQPFSLLLLRHARISTPECQSQPQ